MDAAAVPAWLDEHDDPVGEDRERLGRRPRHRQAHRPGQVREVPAARQRDHRARPRLRPRRHAVPRVVGRLARRGAGRHPPATRPHDARRGAGPAAHRQRAVRLRRRRRLADAQLPARHAAPRARPARRPRLRGEGRVRGRGDDLHRLDRRRPPAPLRRPDAHGLARADRLPPPQLAPAAALRRRGARPARRSRHRGRGLARRGRSRPVRDQPPPHRPGHGVRPGGAREAGHARGRPRPRPHRHVHGEAVGRVRQRSARPPLADPRRRAGLLRTRRRDERHDAPLDRRADGERPAR